MSFDSAHCDTINFEKSMLIGKTWRVVTVSQDSDDTRRYDARQESMNYGTIWTNSLFDSDKSVLKISRGTMIDIRIPWVSIIWGGGFGLIGLFFGWLFFIRIFGGGMLLWPIVVLVTLAFGLVGVKLGNWSPMQKSTGEDLITYVTIVIRQKLSTGGIGKGSVSTVELNSKAVGGEEGRVTKCQLWLGTQPLRDAPPMSLYEVEGGFSTEYRMPPRGEFKVISPDDYNDGLGDRF